MNNDSKKRIWIIIGIIVLILFVVGLMLKFWKFTIVALVCFLAGYIYGRQSAKEKGEKKSWL